MEERSSPRATTGNTDGGGFSLVLGGGGPVGAAYIIGVLRGLVEAGGLDPNAADVIIGTSAGAIMGADLRQGRTVDEISDILQPAPVLGVHPHDIIPAWRSNIELVRRSIGSTWVMARTALPPSLRTPAPPRAMQRFFPGSLMAIADGEWAAQRFPDEWPERPLWEVAWNLDDGRRIVLRRGGGRDGERATFRQAVVASSAVPGVFSPVRVGSRRMVDGGVMSANNLDLAVRTPSRIVIAVAPMGFNPRDRPGFVHTMTRSSVNTQLTAEAAAVRGSGKMLLLLRPTADKLRHQGLNVMSRRHNCEVIEAAAESTARRVRRGRPKALLERARG